MAERFGQASVHALAFGLRQQVVVGADSDNARLGSVLLEVVNQGDSIEVGEVEVDDEKVKGRAGFNQGKRLMSILCFTDLVASYLEND